MKILTSSEMKAADEATFSRLSISSRLVMENAGRSITNFLLEKYSNRVTKGVLVLAGSGNNAGDGFVIARTLKNLGLDVKVLLISKLSSLSGDCLLNAESYLKSGGEIKEVTEFEIESSKFDDFVLAHKLLIDALLGTGVSGPLREPYASLINKINQLRAKDSFEIISVDLPSGVDGGTARIGEQVISADSTVALQCLKVGNALYPGAKFSKETFVVDIGIPNQFDEIASIKRELLTKERVAKTLKETLSPSKQDHKGSKGHVLVVGGSEGKYGAPKLSAKASLLSGAGVATMLLPKSVSEKVELEVEELMCVSLEDDGEGNFLKPDKSKLAEILEKKASLVLGPGLGLSRGSKLLVELISQIAAEKKIPLVVDADALNILAEDYKVADSLAGLAVLTPHPGEAARLLNCSVAEIIKDRLSSVSKLSAKYKCWTALKGARTLICSPENDLYVNPAAVETLATAGSGDVLAGIVAAFLARGMSQKEALLSGVFVHGLAGEELCSKNKGTVGSTAKDIYEMLPSVINKLTSFEEQINLSYRKVF